MSPPLIAVAQVGVFLFIWLFSALLLPLSVALAYFFNSFVLLLLLVFYYAFRFVMPAEGWDALNRMNTAVREKYLFFDKQELVFEDDIKITKDTKSLFSWAPHGMVCMGWSLNGNCSSAFLDANVYWLASALLLRIPVISDYLQWCHAKPASKESMLNLMQNGKNLALIPGGFQEASTMKYGVHSIYIKKRAGFLKYALMYGYRVYPVYTFGEELTYRTWNGFESIRMKLNDYQIPTVFFWGWGLSFFLPRPDAKLFTVVGKPLELPQIENPTTEQVAEWHAKYIERVQALFDKYKGRYAAEKESAKLIIL